MQASDHGLWALELGSNKMHPALLVLLHPLPLCSGYPGDASALRESNLSRSRGTRVKGKERSVVEACAGSVPVSGPDSSPSGGCGPPSERPRGDPVPWSEASALSPLLNHELLKADLIF